MQQFSPQAAELCTLIVGFWLTNPMKQKPLLQWLLKLFMAKGAEPMGARRGERHEMKLSSGTQYLRSVLGLLPTCRFRDLHILHQLTLRRDSTCRSSSTSQSIATKA